MNEQEKQVLISIDDPRVKMATERTLLALERTHLAWIRTLFTIITTGLAIDKGLELLHSEIVVNKSWANKGHIVGTGLIFFGTVLVLAETYQFIQRSYQLSKMNDMKFRIFSTSTLLSAVVVLLGISLSLMQIFINR